MKKETLNEQIIADKVLLADGDYLEAQVKAFKEYLKLGCKSKLLDVSYNIFNKICGVLDDLETEMIVENIKEELPDYLKMQPF